MNKEDVKKLAQEDMLQETLAMTRTRLSVERTFLAYIRTALTLVIAGTSLIQFFEITVFRYSGFIFIGLGLLTFVLGFVRFRRNRGKLKSMNRHLLDLVESDF